MPYGGFEASFSKKHVRGNMGNLPTDIQKELSVDYRISFQALAHDVAPITSPVLIDPYNGNVYEINASRFFKGIEVRNLPVAEYPLVICDRGMFHIVPDGTL